MSFSVIKVRMTIFERIKKIILETECHITHYVTLFLTFTHPCQPVISFLIKTHFIHIDLELIVFVNDIIKPMQHKKHGLFTFFMLKY